MSFLGNRITGERNMIWARRNHAMLIKCLVASILGLPVVSQAQAGKVKVWLHDRPEQFDKAQLKQAVVTNEGAIRLSRRLQPLAELDAAHVWDIVENKQGDLIVATGNEGKIFHVSPEAKITVAFESQDTEV